MAGIKSLEIPSAMAFILVCPRIPLESFSFSCRYTLYFKTRQSMAEYIADIIIKSEYHHEHNM